LGEFTDELDGDELEEFHCAGPKQYLLIKRDKDGNRKTDMKIRGMTLDENTVNEISVERFIRAVSVFFRTKPLNVLG